MDFMKIYCVDINWITELSQFILQRSLRCKEIEQIVLKY
jgi:hypothetical protein